METTKYEKLLETIHNTTRNTANVHLFSKPTKVVLLDFLGASDFFVTEFGAIWHRRKVYPNKLNLVWKGYLPMVVKDRLFPYPWVLLPTRIGEYWIPVNQILGWAFNPNPNTDEPYFLSSVPSFTPMMLDTFSWYSEEYIYGENDLIDTLGSTYINFISHLYSGK